MSNALRNVNAHISPQTESAHASQTQNNAGGYVFGVSDASRLERFLILGTDEGTYYVGEREFTHENVEFLRKLIIRDEVLVRTALVDVSINARAYRNSSALFVLALLFTEGKDKAGAREAFSQVVRTSTHLFEFAQYVENLGGWGRAKRGAVANWYSEKDTDELAYQLVKYRQRNGWTHKDMLRLSHPRGLNSSLVNFALGKEHDNSSPLIEGFVKVQASENVKDVLSVLESQEYENLPWETLPTKFLTDPQVWKTLFYNGVLSGQALVRNVSRMGRIGAFNDMVFAADYANKLADETMIARTRLHPINFLNAIVGYTEGRQKRSDFYSWDIDRVKDWECAGVVVDALNAGFYTSFKTITPAGKRTLVGVDVSGSMASPALGVDLSCAQVSAAMAMTIARTEPTSMIRGFTCGENAYGYNSYDSAELSVLNITAATDLSTAMQRVQKQNFGGTDCALPVMWALENKVEVDTFVVITDCETWAGNIHPFQAIQKYRKEMGIDARMAVLGVASNGFTIADPNDTGMMDFAGFDANTPKVLNDFSAGRL